MGSLKLYQKKRKLKETKEPRALKVKRKGFHFVIHKHKSRNLHFDLRLEIGGVLASFAIPKGIPMKKGLKRLAIETEDHPLSYRNFEGVIPKGYYGAGRVEIWDKGSFENLKKDKNQKIKSMQSSKKDGLIKVSLIGKKVHGVYALLRFKEKNWLIFLVKNLPVFQKAGKN